MSIIYQLITNLFDLLKHSLLIKVKSPYIPDCTYATYSFNLRTLNKLILIDIYLVLLVSGYVNYEYIETIAIYSPLYVSYVHVR